MSNKVIFFHRHGETIYSKRGGGYGDNEYRATLTERGRKEAELLGAELAKRGPFDLYLSSHLPRAVHTASIVQQFLQMPFECEPNLGEPIKEAQADTWRRVTKLAQSLVDGPHNRILLSTHGFVYYCMTTYFRGLKLGELKDFVNPPTGAFGWVEFVDGKPTRACRECTTHLQGLGK